MKYNTRALEASILDVLVVKTDSVLHSAEGWQDKLDYARDVDHNLMDAILDLIDSPDHECALDRAVQRLAADGCIEFRRSWFTITDKGRAAWEATFAEQLA